jgi:hypothetical protein
MVEGFWVVQVEGVQGSGGGVLVLLKGHVFGGDNAFLYKGTYETDESVVSARVSVHRFLSGVVSILGIEGDYELLLRGTVAGDVIKAKATVANREVPGLVVKLTKVCDLPR